MFINAPEKLFTKVVISKGYGFNTPQDGSVCKIKITLDESSLLSGFDEEQIKEIIVGDVDEPVDRIIEDCIRTMKEKEECYIEFLDPNAYAENIILVDSCDDIKDVNRDIVVDCSESAKTSSSHIDDATGNVHCNPDSKSKIASDEETENIIRFENQGNNDNNLDQTSNADSHAIEGINTESCVSNKSSNLVKIQFQLLSYTIEPEIWEMSVTEKWRRASYHKEKGLELYARGMYQYAFRRFGLTLKYLISLEHDVPSDEKDMDIKGLKLSCYLNLAACQMRHHNFESVVKNSSKALNLQPNNAKALYRRGAAYVELQEYEKAKEDLITAQQLEPKNQAIAKQLQILKARVQKLNQYYASAMKKMFS